MKTTTKIFGMLMIMAAFTFMEACKGEKGDVGPTGTAGVAGTAGATGATGAAGAAIYSSAWSAPTWTYNTQYKYWAATITAPQITQTIIDKGDVHVYIKIDDKQIRDLPYFDIWTANGNTITQVITHNASADGKILLSSGFISPNVNPGGNPSFRYVVIPPSTNGRKPAIDFSDYNAVKAYYNLKD
jgi:hypothetical protein